MYLYTCIHIYTYAYKHTHTQTHSVTHTHSHTHTRTHTYTQVLVPGMMFSLCIAAQVKFFFSEFARWACLTVAIAAFVGFHVMTRRLLPTTPSLTHTCTHANEYAGVESAQANALGWLGGQRGGGGGGGGGGVLARCPAYALGHVGNVPNDQLQDALQIHGNGEALQHTLQRTLQHTGVHADGNSETVRGEKGVFEEAMLNSKQTRGLVFPTVGRSLDARSFLTRALSLDSRSHDVPAASNHAHLCAATPLDLARKDMSHTATHCNTLQHLASKDVSHTATHCNTLQHTCLVIFR